MAGKGGLMMKVLLLLVHALSIFMIAICCSVSSSAQTPSYHVEFSEGSSGQVILVNDSAKPIEAFYLWKQCGAAMGMSLHDTPRPGGSGFGGGIQDALSGVGDRIGIPGAKERMATQSEIVAPGGRFISSMSIDPDPGSMKCEVKSIAAVFTDGSVEGDDQVLLGMQARRDGIASGVRYWMAKLNPDSGEMQAPEAILSDAESRSRVDQQKWKTAAGPVDTVVFTAAYNYWIGRFQVDEWIRSNLKDEPTYQDPADTCKSLARMISAWQKKIDNDVAMKKLAATFPLPEGIADPDPQPAP